MSAIGGLFGRVVLDGAPAVARMLDGMKSRGPDARAIRRESDRPVTLGIGQLKVAAGEPDADVLVSEDGNLLMVCDGQVFNHQELAAGLRQRGHTLRSAQSCEVLLHLFEEQGERGLRVADGQFALAIYDRKQNRLVLARDFLGVRSLYYHAGADGVMFASEVKGLLRHPNAPRSVDEVAVSHYLTFLTVPGPRTMFAGVNKLPPGSCAICTEDGRVELRRFWSLLDEPIPESDDINSYVERVRDLHGAAVKRRTTDGPIAALVSGGNDSSANAAYMARFSVQPLHTVTVGLAEFEGDAKYNDLTYAKQVAELIGSHHRELLLSTGEFLDTIPKTVDAMDDMVSEPSSVFLYHALRLARESGAKVVVTGEANDELCCGHGEMIRIRNSYYEKWAPFMQKPAMVRKLAAAAAPLISPKRTEVLRRAAANDEYFWNFEIAWMESEKAEILTPAALDRLSGKEGPQAVVARYAAELRASEHGRRDYLNYIVYVMMQDYYFGNLMLGKLDLLASGLGIEPRCPYTEPAYAHWVYNVPAKFKFQGDTVKYFFKKAIEGVLPESIIYRPKQGFRTPVVELFKGPLADWARPVLLDGGLTKSGMLRRDALERLLAAHARGERDYSNRLWTAMVLNLWHDRWIASAPGSSAGEAAHGYAAVRA